MPKIILTKPIKTKAGWVKAGETLPMGKAEADRLGKKGACAILLADSSATDDQSGGKDQL